MESVLKRMGVMAGVLLVVALVVAGCGGGGSSSSSSTTEASTETEESETEAVAEESESGTVAVDVGNGQTVELPKGKLTIGLFPPGESNEYLKVWTKGAEEEAKVKGWKTVLFNPEFDPNEQLNEAETAIQQGTIDAAVVQPVEGSVVCNAFTKEAPAANILVSVSVNPLCGLNLTPGGKESPEGNWAPGTLNFVDSNNYIAFQEKWFEATAEANPGKQDVALVLGPAAIGQTHLTEAALKSYEEKNPEFHVSGIIETDYTSATGLSKTQNYLQANPDTTVIMSIYSPDLTRGVLQAIEEAGLKGKVAVTDQGGSKYSFEQVENGNLEFTMGYFPGNATKLQIDSIAEAQEGKEPARFVDDSVWGSTEEPTVITKKNAGEFEPEY